jgi:hypothetical protein
MPEEGAFIIWLTAIIWIGWPLHSIASHLAALRKKAGA